jgi:hypothetical protein
MEQSWLRALVIPFVTAVIGGISVFLFQEVWRDKANLVVEIVPNSLLNVTDGTVLSNDLERLEKLQNEKGVFGEDANNYDLRSFRDTLVDLVADKKVQLQFYRLRCGYEVTLNNNGVLPAEDVFVKIPSSKLFVETHSYRVFDPRQLSAVSNDTIQLGQVKQGVTKSLFVFAEDCEFNGSDLSAGHRSGKATLRYVKIPFNLPNLVIDYPFLTLMYLLSALFIVVIGLAIVSQALQRGKGQN